MIAIYDGRCLICRKFAGLLRRGVAPGRMDVVGCASSIQRKLAPMIRYSACKDDFVLIEDDGTVLRGALAAQRALACVRGFSLFAPVIESSIGRVLARATYRLTGMVRKKSPCCRGSKNTETK